MNWAYFKLKKLNYFFSRLNQIYEEIKKEKLDVKSMLIDVACEDMEGNDVDIPTIKYYL